MKSWKIKIVAVIISAVSLLSFTFSQTETTIKQKKDQFHDLTKDAPIGAMEIDLIKK